MSSFNAGFEVEIAQVEHAFSVVVKPEVLRDQIVQSLVRYKFL